MSNESKLSRYPAAYSKILLALPLDGTAISFTLSSAEAANTERLKFYNFLKFLRRNKVEAAHFGDRINRTRISLKGSSLEFALSVPRKAESDLDYALDAALKGGSVLDVALPVDISEPDPLALPLDDRRTAEEFSNPMAIFEAAQRKKEQK